MTPPARCTQYNANSANYCPFAIALTGLLATYASTKRLHIGRGMPPASATAEYVTSAVFDGASKRSNGAIQKRAFNPNVMFMPLLEYRATKDRDELAPASLDHLVGAGKQHRRQLRLRRHKVV